MNVNETPIDRALRAAFGMAILAAPLVGFHIGPWNLVGLVPMITGIVGYCPLYGLLGTSTCSASSYQHTSEGVLIHKSSHSSHAHAA